MKPKTELDWTVSTVFIGIVASLLGLALVLLLEHVLGVAEAGLERYLLGGFCGAFGVVAKHRKRPLLALLVFVPVLSFLLLAGAVLFHVYVLGNPIEL